MKPAYRRSAQWAYWPVMIFTALVWCVVISLLFPFAVIANACTRTH